MSHEPNIIGGSLVLSFYPHGMGAFGIKMFEAQEPPQARRSMILHTEMSQAVVVPGLEEQHEEGLLEAKSMGLQDLRARRWLANMKLKKFFL